MTGSLTENLITLEHFVNFTASSECFPTPFCTPQNCELCEIITAGCVLYQLEDGREMECLPGSIFWHMPGEYTVYRYKAGMPYSCIALKFRMKTPPKRRVHRLTVWEPFSEVENFIKQIWHCFNEERNNRKWLSEYVYTTLFWKAYQYSRITVNTDVPLEIKKAVTFIDRKSGAINNVNEIAAEAGVSVPHLHHLFKQHLDDTPHQLLLRKRMQEARNLLTTTNIPIKQICSICGFVSLENFCRKFRKNTGLAPSQYRKKHTVIA